MMNNNDSDRSTEKNNLEKRVKSEIEALFGLIVINLVMSALVMGIGISIAVTQITGMVESGTFNIWVPIIALASLIPAAIGIRWIISTASLMEGVTDLKEKYAERLKDRSETGIAGIIVQLLATYRLNKPTIKQMTTISRAGGMIFAFGGFLQAMAFLLVLPNASTMTLMTGMVGLICIFGLAIACLYIPSYLDRYSITWDKRIAHSLEMEAKLKKQLGGSQ